MACLCAAAPENTRRAGATVNHLSPCAGEAGALSSPGSGEERRVQLFYLINGQYFEHILSKSYFKAKGGIVAKWQSDSVSSKLPFGTGLSVPSTRWSCRRGFFAQCNLSRSRKSHSLPLVEISPLYVICLSDDQMARTALTQNNKRSTVAISIMCFI